MRRIPTPSGLLRPNRQERADWLGGCPPHRPCEI